MVISMNFYTHYLWFFPQVTRYFINFPVDIYFTSYRMSVIEYE
jgi:hypothetical protein